MSLPTKQIREWSNVTQEMFVREIAPRSEPAIFRGFVNDWSIVKKSSESNESVSDYLKGFDNGSDATTWVIRPELNGKFFYQDTMKSFNFDGRKESLGRALDNLLESGSQARPFGLFTGATLVSQCLPKLQQELSCPWLGTSVPARIWIGNKVTVQTHYDNVCNIACVAAGTRRFTLFPPSQVNNLYPGPMEFTPAGTPISMVQLHDPDLNKYPKFAEALDSAEVAELGPGDAIYIPPLWWHHVESLSSFNVLVNFWWDGFQKVPDAPLTCLTHGLMSIASLSEEDRMAWRAMFDHYVFKIHGEPLDHLAPEHRGMLGDFNQDTYKAIKQSFLEMYKENQVKRS